MKLISMTEFVLDIPEQFKRNIHSGSQWQEVVMNYANFLNQPLELGMFEGENRLFDVKNFRTETRKSGVRFNDDDMQEFKYYVYDLETDGIEHPVYIPTDSRTVESITGFSPTLTEKAIKQIGL